MNKKNIEEDYDFQGDDGFDDLEKQIAEMSDGEGDHVDHKPKKPAAPAPAKGGNKPAPKPAFSDDHDDLEAQILAMEGGEEEEEHPKPKPTATAPGPAKQAPPKQTPSKPAPTQPTQVTVQPSQVQPKPVPKPAEPAPQKAAPPKKPVNSTPVEGEDENGVAEDILIEEEGKYHNKDHIRSISALNAEIETYMNNILDNKLVGSDYRDALESSKDEWELYINRTKEMFASQKLTMEKYLKVVLNGKELQERLKEAATKNKASITTLNRINKRLEVIEQEIRDIEGELGGGNSEPQPQEAHTEPVEKPQEKPAKAPDQTKSEMPKPKKEYKVPKEKLEELSKVLNQYLYLGSYWQTHGMTPNKEILTKVIEAKQLFKDPMAITPEQYKKAMSNLPPVTMEMVLGMTPSERDAKVELALKEANEVFERMKDLECSKDEAIPTVDVIKYLKKVKENKLVPLPEIETKSLEKQVNIKHTNSNIPDDTVRVTFQKLSGAAGHRTFFLKYWYDIGGNHHEGVTDYVGLLLISA